MKRYVNSIVPLCSMIAVAGSLNIMLDSNKNLASNPSIVDYKHALLSEELERDNLVDDIKFITDITEEKMSEIETKVVETNTLPIGVETRVVDAYQINVRTGSNKNTTIITRVMKNDVLGLTGNKDGNWVEVIIQDELGTIGWVNSNYLR